VDYTWLFYTLLASDFTTAFKTLAYLSNYESEYTGLLVNLSE